MMTPSCHKRSLLPGVMLILIGAWILSRNFLNDFSIWEQVYPLFILAFGVALLIEAYWHKRKGPLFWGVFFLCISGFHLMRTYDIIPYLYLHEYWPLGLSAVGLGMLVVYLFSPRDTGQLIFSILFILVGFALFSRTAFGIIEDFHVAEWLWPAALITAGAGLIYRGWRHNG
jgi:hypothetical protein